VITNKTPYGAYRGFGKADSNFVMERVMEKLARKLDVDPAELRMRNLIECSEFPYRSATGAIYDSGDYKRSFSKLLHLIDYPRVKHDQARLRREGKYEGVGLAFVIEPSGVAYPGSFIANYDSVTIRMDPSGKVTVLSGGAPQGQSYETVTAQLVADVLGIEMDEISVSHGDTQLCPYGLGSYSSRFSVILAPAIVEAATQMKEKLLKAAAYFLRAEEASLKLSHGYLVMGDSEEKMEIRSLARMMYTNTAHLPPGISPGLETTVFRSGSHSKGSNGEDSPQNLYLAHSYAEAAVVVRVDPEVGLIQPLRFCIVHDCGNVINEAIVEGQVVGGAVQGIGGALYEELVYNGDGDLLTSPFMDYLIPSAPEVPVKIELERTVTPSPFVPGGYKGAGEAGTICSPPAFANAVDDALSAIASGVNSMPLKPEAIWRKIRGVM
jgi:carbon-monoxide dehydrogenase large subunit